MEKILWALNKMPKSEDKCLPVMSLDEHQTGTRVPQELPAVFHHPACKAGRYG